MRFSLRSPRQPPEVTNIRVINPWHAVSVRSAQKHCPAVQALGKHRFLAGEAPALPLADCPFAATCRCVYQHHDDRRAMTRRAADDGRPAPLYPRDERRHAPGRRRTDLP